MDDPHDDTDVPSGTTDGAQMESTSPPVLRLDLRDLIFVSFCSLSLALSAEAAWCFPAPPSSALGP